MLEDIRGFTRDIFQYCHYFVIFVKHRSRMWLISSRIWCEFLVDAGIFVALALRFDLSRGHKKIYFYSAFAGYCAGLLVTILIMNWFQTAQVLPRHFLNVNWCISSGQIYLKFCWQYWWVLVDDSQRCFILCHVWLGFWPCIVHGMVKSNKYVFSSASLLLY